MTKQKSDTPIMDWIDNHFGWFLALVIILFICIITTSAIVYEKSAEDRRVYEDNQLICYEDNTHTDKPNSRQQFYCINRATKEKTCEYDYSRGSGNKPPQGCYL